MKMPSFFLLFILALWMLSPAFAQPVKNYRIADNLWAPINGEYPGNSQPAWLNIISENTNLSNTERFMIWREDSRFGKRRTDEWLAIGEYKGKAVIYFYGYYGCLHAGELSIPSGRAVLSQTPQTFAVRNIEKVRKGGDDCDANQPWRPNFDHFGVSVTLSCNEKGDVIISYFINTYTVRNELFQKIYADNLLFKLKNSPGQANSVANSPYKEVAERIGAEYHEGFRFHELFIPNSVRNISVEKTDKSSDLLKLRVDCMFKIGNGPMEGWFDILLIKGVPFGVVFFPQPLTCITPVQYQGNTPVAYTSTELEAVRKLQSATMAIYLEPVLRAKYAPKSTCLVTDVFTYYKDAEYKEKKYDFAGNEYYVTRKYKTEDSKVPGLRNGCSTDTYVLGISRTVTSYSVKLSDATIRLRSGEVIPAASIQDEADYDALMDLGKERVETLFK